MRYLSMNLKYWIYSWFRWSRTEHHLMRQSEFEHLSSSIFVSNEHEFNFQNNNFIFHIMMCIVHRLHIQRFDFLCLHTSYYYVFSLADPVPVLSTPSIFHTWVPLNELLLNSEKSILPMEMELSIYYLNCTIFEIIDSNCEFNKIFKKMEFFVECAFWLLFSQYYSFPFFSCFGLFLENFPSSICATSYVNHYSIVSNR